MKTKRAPRIVWVVDGQHFLSPVENESEMVRLFARERVASCDHLH